MFPIKHKSSKNCSAKRAKRQKRRVPSETVYLLPVYEEALKNLQTLAPYVKKSRLIAEAILHMWEMVQRNGFDGGTLRPRKVEKKRSKKSKPAQSKGLGSFVLRGNREISHTVLQSTERMPEHLSSSIRSNNVESMGKFLTRLLLREQRLPEHWGYGAVCWRDREGNPVRVWNKPNFVFSIDEEKIRSLPVARAYPGHLAERTMDYIRQALDDGRSNADCHQFEREGELINLKRQFFSVTPKLAICMCKTWFAEKPEPGIMPTEPLALSRLFQSRLHLYLTDPQMVFWINKDFFITDQRYQSGTLFHRPEKVGGPLSYICDELPAREAAIEYDYIRLAIETGEPVVFNLKLHKQKCLVTEEVHVIPLSEDHVMKLVYHVQSIPLNCRYKFTDILQESAYR